MEYFKFVPLEITSDILSRVPTESVLECKSVCKTWNNLVSQNPSFTTMHLNHLNNPTADSCKLSFLALTHEFMSSEKLRYFEYDESKTTPIKRIRRFNLTMPFVVASFYGSCNGLICIDGQLPSEPLCICNPVTKEYVLLPDTKRHYRNTDLYFCKKIGFGYVSSTSEYKVLRIHVLKDELVEVHIYTLGSGNGWRNLGRFHFEFSQYHGKPGVFANGAIYWMGAQSGMILAFDLCEEKFCENLSAPRSSSDRYWQDNSIGVLGGFLFFAVYLAGQWGARRYEIWLLRKKNGNHGIEEQREENQSVVWSKEFRIGARNFFAITKTGGVLTYGISNLQIYDTKALTSKTLFVESEERFLGVYPHRNSLVSLQELGEEDTKIMEPWSISSQELLSFIARIRGRRYQDNGVS